MRAKVFGVAPAVALLLVIGEAGATNAPCSGAKGGIAACRGSTFNCQDGSTSGSKKDCRTYEGGRYDAPTATPASPRGGAKAPIGLLSVPAHTPPAQAPEAPLARPTETPVTPSAEGVLSGRASTIDGDTIEIHGTRIRLEGIDAPESRQTCQMKDTGEATRCGQRAAFYLSDMLGEHTVTCTEAGRDRYKRMLAHCEVVGQDVGAAMVRAGWALAFVRFSREYLPQEEEARAAGAGMWATDFVSPWDWRKGMR